MQNPLEWNPEPSPEQDDDALRGVMEAIWTIDPGAQGSLETYVTMDFTDEQGAWVEARVLRTAEPPSVLTLNTNVGTPLASLELERRFRALGITIHQLAAIHASPSEAEALQRATAGRI